MASTFTANDLNSILPVTNKAMKRYAREMRGHTSYAATIPGAESIAVGETVRVPVVPKLEASNIVPGLVTPDNKKLTLGTENITLTKQRKVSVSLTLEEDFALAQGGESLEAFNAGLMAQAFETLTGEIDTDIATAAITGAGRGYDPDSDFMSKLQHAIDVRKMFVKQGSPRPWRAVLEPDAYARMLGLASIHQVQNAGTQQALLEGQFPRLFGMDLVETATEVNRPTTATGTVNTNTAGATAQNGGSLAAGSRLIPVDGAGAANIRPGQLFKITGDSSDSVYSAGGRVAGGLLQINEPGLAEAIPDNRALTFIDSGPVNVLAGFGSVAFAARAPARRRQDKADDVSMVVDPVTNAVFELALYADYRVVTIDIATVWGVKAISGDSIINIGDK